MTVVRKLATATSLIAASMVAACGQPAGQAEDGPLPRVMTVLMPGDERAMGPYWDMSGQFLVFLPLFELDESGQVVGKLAERWEHSPDWRRWTFYLRDVRWHDGVPVTAADIEFTLRTRLAWGQMPAGRTIDDIEIIDDRTLTVTYSAPTDARDYWAVYWPAHLLGDVGPEELLQDDFWVQPVGNGPFRYVRHVDKTMTELEANSDYYKGRPALDGIILKYGTGPQKLTELLSGAVQGLGFVERPSLHKLGGDDRYRVLFERGEWMLAAYFKLDEPPLDDVRVRRALALGLDRTAIAELLELPPEFETFDTIRPHHLLVPSTSPAPYPYDPDAARSLLEQAGWTDADGDGVRERDEAVLRIPARVAPVSFEGAALPEIAVLAQAQWRRIGVDLEIEFAGTQITRQLERGEFSGIGFDRFLDAAPHHLQFFGPDSTIGFADAALRQQIGRAYSDSTPGERGAAFEEIMPAFQALAPILFLAPQSPAHVVDARYHGLSSPYRADPVWHAEYIDPGRRP